MKPAALLAVLLSALVPATHAQFALVVKLLNTFGLSEPLECALPCVLDAANELPCTEAGAADTICNNVDLIAERTKPCTARCQADAAAGFVVDVVRFVCKHNGMPTNRGAEEQESNDQEEPAEKSEEEKPDMTESKEDQKEEL